MVKNEGEVTRRGYKGEERHSVYFPFCLKADCQLLKKKYQGGILRRRKRENSWENGDFANEKISN